MSGLLDRVYSFDDVVRMAKEVLINRAYAKHEHAAVRSGDGASYYDIREAERQARAYEARLRQIADSAIESRRMERDALAKLNGGAA